MPDNQRRDCARSPGSYASLSVTLSIGITSRSTRPPVPSAPDRRLTAFVCWAHMAIQQMDNVAIVVEDLDAAVAFFTELGMELEGKGLIEGPWADRTVGLDGVRSEIAMMRAPDGHGKLELTRYHAPRRSMPWRRACRPTRWACIASCSLSMTSMTPLPACAPTAPNSSARWHGTRTSSCCATSVARGHHRRPSRADRLTRPCRGDSAHDLTWTTFRPCATPRGADLGLSLKGLILGRRMAGGRVRAHREGTPVQAVHSTSYPRTSTTPLTASTAGPLPRAKPFQGPTGQRSRWQRVLPESCVVNAREMSVCV
jgi:hypothetical protein